MRKLLVLLMTGIFALTALFGTSTSIAYAKGSSGGAKSSGGFKSSAPKSSTPSTSKSSTPKSTAPKSSTPKSSTLKSSAPKVNTSPKSTTQTKTTADSKPQTVSGKTYAAKGYVTGPDYQPKFQGYSAPIGSVVYYRQNSALDWLPYYFLFTHSSHREAVVTSPDGKTQTVKEEGTDGMYVLNWILAILIGLGFIGLVVWLINKYAKRKETYV